MRSSYVLFIALGLVFSSSVALAAPSFTQAVPMRDGIELATDVYLPEGEGPFPVVVTRTPYGKAMGQDVADGLRSFGIVTVVQDARGRFDSQGADCVFLCEGEDGFDTLAWIEKQSWCNGKVVTWGGSALGITQYMTAVHAPAVVDAMWVEVATPTAYQHAFCQNGAFLQMLMENWLAGQGSEFFLETLAAHPFNDGTWDQVETTKRFGDVVVPAVHYGGWYDIFAQGTIDAFVGYQHQGGVGAKGKQKLVMGPWTHGLHNTQVGDLTYPANAADVPGGADSMLSTWFLHYLGIAPAANVDAIPTVQYYTMGDVTDSSAPGNEWHTADDWPIPAAPIRMHLHPHESLEETCPPISDGRTTYTYDPSNPTPTRGGANLFLTAGPVDQSEIEKRDDVITFTSPVIDEPMEITGRVRARLWVETDVIDTDINVRMTDVYPDGRSILILDGVQRLGFREGATSLVPMPLGEPVEVTVDLWSTSIILNAGHRLRLSISSSNAPRFWPNPNDGSTYGQKASPRIAKVAILHDEQHPSYIEVPNPNRSDTDVTNCSAVDAGVDSSTDGAADAHHDVEDESQNETGFPDAGIDATADGAIPAASSDANGGCGCRSAAAPSSFSGGVWLLFLGFGILGNHKKISKCNRLRSS